MASINPQRVALGRRLRELREAAGLARGQVDRHMDWHEGKTSRVERGDRVPVKAEITLLADLFRITPHERSALHLLADSARKRVPTPRVADFSQSYMSFERQATRIRTWDAELIHGLLQTEPYARAVLATRSLPDMEAILADRMARRSVLTKAPVVQALIGEGALHREVGGGRVMRDQLAHLIEVAAMPNVQIRILPFAAGAHLAMGVGFTHLVMPDMERIYIEGLTDATYIHEPVEVEVYERGFDVLWAQAASHAESVTILRTRIDS